VTVTPLIAPAPRAFVLVLAAASVAAAPAGAQACRDLARELDPYVARAVQDWRVPGLAIAVVGDGRVVFAKGYGVRELGKPAPVDTQTLFAIGSTTKAMTAAALGLLVDAGKVRWDDPVTRHLPDFQLYDPYVTREVTVRDLLTHRAGLGNADFLWYGTENSRAEIVRRARLVRPAYSLRAGFVYQNVMYAVAGAVVAAAAGVPWETFVATRLFAPLGMTRTVPTLAQARSRPNVASPHSRVDDTLRVIRNASVDAIAPAGAVWSSAADMAKWIRFLLDSARVDGKRLLQPATLAELLKPQTVVPAAGFYPTAQLTRPHWTTYGLGWFQEDYAGRMVDFHTGSIDGMVAVVGLIPDDGLGVVVLANADHAEARHALMYKTFDLCLGRPSRDWSGEMRALYDSLRAHADSATKAQEAKRVLGTRPTLPLEKYAGTYADSLVGRVVVRLDAGKLWLRSGTMEAELEHWQYDTFRARWRDRWQEPELVSFAIGASGLPDRLETSDAIFRREEDKK
jgi:CubicO group peptidase (beta-lactamase class C family)